MKNPNKASWWTWVKRTWHLMWICLHDSMAEDAATVCNRTTNARHEEKCREHMDKLDHLFPTQETTHEALAESIARKFHTGRFRRDGVTPEISHPEEVVRILKSFAEKVGLELPPHVTAAAWLHDVLEKTACTVMLLQHSWISTKTIDLVQVMTHLPNESYHDYITRICEDKWAAFIKAVDIYTNITDLTTDRQYKKYAVALQRIVLALPPRIREYLNETKRLDPR